MRIVLAGKSNWFIQGVALLLEQAGVPFRHGAAGSEVDIVISDEFADLPQGACGLFAAPFHEGRVRRGGTLYFEGRRIHCPFDTVIPPLPDGAECLAHFDDGSPAVFRNGNAFCMLPDLFTYIARLSTLRNFSKPFAESLSWDAFRELLIRLLEMCADRLSRPLVRLWYYPEMRWNNSISFTTDVDHGLAWDIVRRLERFTRAKAVMNRVLPHGVKMFLAMSVHTRYHNTEIPDSHLTARRAFWTRAFARMGVRLPSSFYPASLSLIHARGIPITVFLRPSARQLEERLDMPPAGTGRLGYAPTALNAFDTGLHFGATVGRLDGGSCVANPYTVDVFGEDIVDQRLSLERETGQPVSGARLHHTYGFNQDMFRYLEQAGVLYDSSIFGSVNQVDTRVSPVGNTMPYRPILEDANQPRRARYVEIPVSVYEAEQIPIESLIRNHSCIVLSEHPDRACSALVRETLRETARRRGSWWPVSLRQLAEWWEAREKAALALEEGAAALPADDGAGRRYCLVAYPASHRPEVAPGTRILAERVSDAGRRFVDVAVH